MENFLKLLQKNFNIRGATTYSKDVQENYIYLAIKGSKFDGNNFIDEAISKGAKIIITDIEKNNLNYQDISKLKNIFENKFNDQNFWDEIKDIEISCTFDIFQNLFIKIRSVREILPIVSKSIYSDISDNLIGVTGTNGKTSTVNYIKQLLEFSGVKSACIGTLGVQLSSDVVLNQEIKTTSASNLTTYDVIDVRNILHNLKKSYVNYCALEASSIGLDQQRLKGIEFDIACFTSFSQDHLDYHKTMYNYLMAKLKLFHNHLKDNGYAIINTEIAALKYICHFLKENGKKYKTIGENGDFKIKFLSSDRNGQKFSIKFENKEYFFEISMFGKFQVENVAMALASLHLKGFDMEKFQTVTKKLIPPIGRMDKVSSIGFGSKIYIDYAHTPDGLENVLIELNDIALFDKSKLILVFGCGGNRDSSKRSQMGKIAAIYADLVIVTDDNPREEDPQHIRKEIIGDNENFIEIANRKDAIFYALDQKSENDIVLIAGKGHEQYQIIGDKKEFFCDKLTSVEFIEKFKKI